MEPARCSRCGQRLKARSERSLEHTLAWLLCALILYVPANLLPVISTSGVRGTQDSTILDGVRAFWGSGDWDLAALIFTASVMVPAAKFAGLGWLLWSVRGGRAHGMAARGRLHRCLEIIGYWSMLDVVVVALSAALLQFENLGSAEPRLGIVFFCAVVVTTMLSAQSFDPRLIWDRAGHA
jgi:paraquat-inducible protein A